MQEIGKLSIDGMDLALVQAMYESLPVELTVIDANDKVVGWNRHHDRLFRRPEACMGMDFRQCHGDKSLPLVEKIVSEMKQGVRKKARFWIDAEVEKGVRHKVLIEFYALKDINGKYIGCLECTQDTESIRNLAGEKRLVDGIDE